MKRNVIVFGSIAALIVTIFMVIATVMLYKNPDFEGSMLMGYTAMLVAFSFVFVGIKNYRDKYNQGLISFGQAFKLGLYITLIASSAYVVVWAIEYNFFMPDFMDKYSAIVINKARTSGASPAEMETTIAEMAKYKEWYGNPIFFLLLTYMEVFPIGLLITLISALILKRKTPKTVQA
jgi:hypothetical protein